MKLALKALAMVALAMTAAVTQAETGVTPTTIVIGQSAAFSGPAQALGDDMRAGALAYFQAINAAGGVNGRKIELRSLDDGYEPDRAAANTKKLIDDGVFLLFGYVGTPTSNASKPIFTAARVPFVGPFTGAESLRNPVNRYIFNVRASYFDETEKIVNQLVGQTLDRIAVFYQNDDYGKAGLAGVERAMQKRNLKIVATGTVERNTVDVAAAVAAIGKSDPQAVVMISAYKSVAAFIKAMRAAGYSPQFMNVSFVGSKALAAEAGPRAAGWASRRSCRSRGTSPRRSSRNISSSIPPRPRRTTTRSRRSRDSSRPRCWWKGCGAPAPTSPARNSLRRWRACAMWTSAAS